MSSALNKIAHESRGNSWGSHLRATFALGVPLVGAQLAQMAIHTTDVILVGWLGTTELASVVIATQVFFIVFIFGTGFTSAVIPLVAQALGHHDKVGVRRAVRRSCGSPSRSFWHSVRRRMWRRMRRAISASPSGACSRRSASSPSAAS